MSPKSYAHKRYRTLKVSGHCCSHRAEAASKYHVMSKRSKYMIYLRVIVDLDVLKGHTYKAYCVYPPLHAQRYLY